MVLSPNFVDPASQQIRTRIMRNLLLHRTLTRREIGQAVSLSGGAVTKHMQWLINRQLVLAQKTKVPTSMRPVEELSINANGGVVLAMRVDLETVAAELVGYDGEPLQCWMEPVAEPTQSGVMAALQRAAERAASTHPRLEAVGLSIVGYLSSEKGVIFGVEGVTPGEWEPCQPGDILPALRRVPLVRAWTDVACKVRGLAGRLKTDERLVYVERIGRAFRLADIQNGRLHLGSHGSTGSKLHMSVAEDGPSCYCGRAGCFAAFLRQPEPLSEDFLGDALYQLLAQVKANQVAVEWEGAASRLVERLQQHGMTGVRATTEGQALRSEGLRALTLEVAFGSKIDAAALA